MKRSIAKIFKNLNSFLLTLLVLSTISLLFILEQYHSYEKIKTLNHQEQVISDILDNQQQTNIVDIYFYNDRIAQINNEISTLQNKHQYHFLSSIILDNSAEYNKDLNKLRSLVKQFDTQSRKYYDMSIEDNNIKPFLDDLNKTFISINALIDAITVTNVSYDGARFDVFMKLFFILFILLVLITFSFKKQLKSVYKDIFSLYTADSKKNYIPYTQEVDSILLRIGRKNQLTDNPAMMDPITEIHNNKGMIQAYAERKNIKDNNFSSIAVVEIDNFSKSKRTFSQEFTQEILKKVAYTISLHQQALDIIARSDYNQFTLIFSRSSKEQLFKDVELVRQSIAELKLTTPEGVTIEISVTGGFVHKAHSAPLDESIRKAKELLKSAKELGKNQILQNKDLPK